MTERLTPRTGQEDCTSCKWGEWDNFGPWAFRDINCAFLVPDNIPVVFYKGYADTEGDGNSLRVLHGPYGEEEAFTACPCYERGEPKVKGEDNG